MPVNLFGFIVHKINILTTQGTYRVNVNIDSSKVPTIPALQASNSRIDSSQFQFSLLQTRKNQHYQPIFTSKVRIKGTIKNMSSVIHNKVKLDWLPEAAEKLRVLMIGTTESCEEDEVPVPAETFDRVLQFLQELESTRIVIGKPNMGLSPNGTLGLTWKDAQKERYVHLSFKATESPVGFLKTKAKETSVKTEAAAFDVLRAFSA